MPINAIFFDLDGTLLDTAADIVGCMNKALEELNLSTDGFMEKFRIGPPLAQAVKEALPDIQDDQIEQFIVRFRHLYDTTDYPNTVPYEGVEEMLAELKRQKRRLFIATNKRMVPTIRLVQKFCWEPLFDEVLTFDMFPGRKLSKVEMLTEAISRNGLTVEGSAMIGDAATDVQAGNDSGLTSVAVTWGYDSPASLAAANPDWTMERVEELFHLLK